MNAREIAGKLRRIVFDGDGNKINANLGVETCEILLVAACTLEEQESKIERDRTLWAADLRIIKDLSQAALNDLNEVTKQHWLCDCCKYLSADGECQSPRENTDGCWVWRGKRPENSTGGQNEQG